jgi:hypothetical protein
VISTPERIVFPRHSVKKELSAAAWARACCPFMRRALV